MRCSAWVLFSLVATSSLAARAASDAANSSSNAAPAGWSQWQGRVSLGTAPTGPGRLGMPSARISLGSASLMGDYYFGRAFVPAGQTGGFRATSGLMYGPRTSFALGDAARADGSGLNMARRTLVPSALLPGSDSGGDGATTVPYLGLGYTGLSPRGGWAYSADLGVAGSSTRPGHSVGSGPSLDDAVRDLRMGPMVQVGVSYAF